MEPVFEQGENNVDCTIDQCTVKAPGIVFIVERIWEIIRVHTAKTKCRKFETNIPSKGISGPQSQFPHSCVSERIIYSHDESACSAGGNM
jgi:hypothetical protein